MNIMGREYKSCNYSKDSIIKMCEGEDPYQLYNLEVINYLSSVSDDDELCNEVVAGWVLKNKRKIAEIKMFTRNKSYFVAGHDGMLTELEKSNPSNRKEEILAKKMHSRYYEPVGEIIDYQVPLKDYVKDNEDRRFGKIDMLSVNEDTKTIHVIEFKKPGSAETMLRCVLEGITYYRVLNKSKLKKDYAWKYRKDIAKGLREDISDYDYVVTPLVFKNSQAYVEMMEMANGHRGNLQRLIDSIGIRIEPCYMDGSNEKAICHRFFEI